MTMDSTTMMMVDSVSSTDPVVQTEMEAPHDVPSSTTATMPTAATTTTTETTATLPIIPKKDKDSEFAPRLSFPLKLYDMLEDAHNKDFSSIVSWNAEGDGFMVHDTASFVKNIICSYYNQSKYKSFQRQLSLYGFTRVTNGAKKGLRAHKSFLRGHRDLVRQMKPLTGATTGGASKASTSNKSASAINKARTSTSIKPSLSAVPVPVAAAVPKETTTTKPMIRSVSPPSSTRLQPQSPRSTITSDSELNNFSISDSTTSETVLLQSPTKKTTVVQESSSMPFMQLPQHQQHRSQPSSTSDVTPEASQVYTIAPQKSLSATSTVSLEDLLTDEMQRALNTEIEKLIPYDADEFAGLIPTGTTFGAALPWTEEVDNTVVPPTAGNATPQQDEEQHQAEQQELDDIGFFEGMTFFLTENKDPNNIITAPFFDTPSTTSGLSLPVGRPLQPPAPSPLPFPTSLPTSSFVGHGVRHMIPWRSSPSSTLAAK